MISGEYRYALDEKARLMVPAPIRKAIAGNLIVVTRGIERCLMVFPPDAWQEFSEKVAANSSLLRSQDRMIRRRLLAPAQSVEIDRTGRIVVPSSLRAYASLDKDCVVLGINTYMEVWDEETYRSYESETDDLYKEAVDDIGTSIRL